MTFDEYITNPLGRSNAVLSVAMREFARSNYTSKFKAILLRESGKIEYHMYKAPDATYYIHIKIPSEVVEKFYYDVVIKFTGDPAKVASFSKLSGYNVQFYSNDPAFVYTYTYVFNKNNMFITELAPKMSKKALAEAAVIKNPDSQVGYVKSLYFAYLFMQQKGLFTKSMYDAAPDFNVKYLLKQIEHADKKIEERQEEGARVRKERSALRSKGIKAKKAERENTKGSSGSISHTKRVKAVKNKVKTSQKVKRR